MAVSRYIFTALLSALNAVPVDVVKTAPDAPLTKAFVSTTGWTGGDAAYSVPLSKSRTLWLFGDTFIGRIDRGVRTKMPMVHNTAAWLDQSSNGTFRAKFFWKENCGVPVSLLEPKEGKAYYWPSSLVESSGKLALFCKVVVDKQGDDSGFGFDWIGDELLVVKNALAAPTQWQYERHALPGGEAAIKPGAACMKDESFTYVYGTMGKQHNMVLMRIRTADLIGGDISRFEYWCHQTEDPASELVWKEVPLYPEILFPGAPEMSVSRVDGLPGYWAVYTENGLSPNILLRHADKPEGPWGEPTLLYRAPEAVRDPKLLCYGAKHHPELAHEPRTLVVTYCLNPGALSAHRTQPFTYFPKAIKIVLGTKPSG